MKKKWENFDGTKQVHYAWEGLEERVLLWGLWALWREKKAWNNKGKEGVKGCGLGVLQYKVQ